MAPQFDNTADDRFPTILKEKLPYRKEQTQI